MKHFELHEWVDFARQKVKADRKSEMECHLNFCEDCARSAHFWQQVILTTIREKRHQVPPTVLRSVRGHFALRWPTRSLVFKRTKFVFDSLFNPFPAGIRSSGASARQLLYRLGNYSIDLRMEVQTDSGRIAVVGQILDDNEKGHHIADLPVSLQCGHHKWAGTKTNHLGEFHFDCPTSDSLQLSFGVNPRRILTVSIPVVLNATSPR